MAGIQVGVYDTKKTIFNAGGKNASGYAEGDKIKIEALTKEQWESEVGVEGDVTLSRNYDERYKLTIRLKAESPYNSHLRLLKASMVPFPVLCKNSSGLDYLGGGAEAVVLERPGATFGTKRGIMEWVFLVAAYAEA
jgi:hypothetical protein